MKKLAPLEDSLDHVPLFPLPGAVLFPMMHMPLHIFEPRYRQMVRDARDNGLPIVIGSIQKVGAPAPEMPAVHTVAGVGQIANMEELPDGRFLIDLVGLARVRIVQERQASTPYRIVRAEVLADDLVPKAEVPQAVSTVTHLVMGMQSRRPRAAGVLASVMADLKDPGELADAIAGVIHTEPQIRQGWLEQTNPLLRLRAVTEVLEDLLMQAPEPKGTLN